MGYFDSFFGKVILKKDAGKLKLLWDASLAMGMDDILLRLTLWPWAWTIFYQDSHFGHGHKIIIHLLDNIQIKTTCLFMVLLYRVTNMVVGNQWDHCVGSWNHLVWSIPPSLKICYPPSETH